MKLLAYTILTALCSTSLMQAQGISGVIVNAKDSLPIAYAHIIHLESNTIAHSDRNGRFNISFPVYNDYTLRISCVGYQTKEIDSRCLKHNHTRIFLKPSALILNEVVILSNRKSPVKILKLGLKNMPDNYAPGPFSAKILGKHSHAVEGKVFSQFEDVADYFPLGRKEKSFTKGETMGRLYYRSLYETKNTLSEFSLHPSGLVTWYYYNLLSIHNSEKLVPGLNSELNFLRDYSRYSYELKRVIQRKPKPIFVIAFRPKKDRDYWSGNIYIEKDTWAILRVECNYSAWKNDNAKSIKESFSCEYFKFNDAYYPLEASYTESIRSRKIASDDSITTKFSRYWEVLDITNGNVKMIGLDKLVDKGRSYSTLADYQKNIIKMRNFKVKAPFVRSLLVK